MPRGCKPSLLPSSSPVNFFPPRAVNTSSSTAVSNTYELQKPNPVLRIREGSRVSLIIIFLSFSTARKFPCASCRRDISVCDAQSPRHPPARLLFQFACAPVPDACGAVLGDG